MHQDQKQLKMSIFGMHEFQICQGKWLTSDIVL